MTDWFRLPWGVVRTMIEVMPEIRSAERLAYISDTAVAGGNVKRQDIRRHLSALQGRWPKVPATAEQLRAMGIRVEHG